MFYIHFQNKYQLGGSFTKPLLGFRPGTYWVTSVPQDTFPFASIHPPKVTEPLTPLEYSTVTRLQGRPVSSQDLLAARGGGQTCRPFVLGFGNWRVESCLKHKTLDIAIILLLHCYSILL